MKLQFLKTEFRVSFDVIHYTNSRKTKIIVHLSTGFKSKHIIEIGLSGKRGKRGKRRKPVIMNYYNKAMFTLYWIVKRSITESVPDRASVHTRIAAFEAVSAPDQYCSAPLRC